jgi:hypothetical protein
MAHRLRYEPQQRILTLSKSTELEITGNKKARGSDGLLSETTTQASEAIINALCRKATIKKISRQKCET